jgi:hypothetical protein
MGDIFINWDFRVYVNYSRRCGLVHYYNLICTTLWQNSKRFKGILKINRVQKLHCEMKVHIDSWEIVTSILLVISGELNVQPRYC